MLASSLALFFFRLVMAAAQDSAPALMPVIAISPRALPERSLPGDWPKYCANLEMTGVASWETAIRKDTVANLVLVWKAQLAASVASEPSVVSGTVYVGDWGGFEWALDADSGKVKASADLGTTVAPQCNPPDLGVTSAPAVVGDTIYLAGGDDAFYALDAQTLAVRWRTSLGDNSAQGGYYGWCSPAVVGSRVLQGVSSNCDSPFVPGRLVALDRGNGELVGQAGTVPMTDPGGGIWTSPAVDLEAGEIFVSTASATDFYDGDAYSVLRLSLSDLSIEDGWRIPFDPEDADWGSSPTLFVDASGRRLFGAGQKNGNYYAFRRDDLAAGPVWATALAIGGNCPQCGNGVLSTAAFDGRHLYVGSGVPPGITVTGTPGAVVALDPSTGAVLWRYLMATGPVIAPISYANGLVFAAGGTTAVALDADTGQELWRFDGDSLFYGGIAISHGRIYFGDLGGQLYAFGPP